eukprot:COSAG06_NODE_43885_length_368_cov_0.743494_2_plen_78_part_01
MCSLRHALIARRPIGRSGKVSRRQRDDAGPGAGSAVGSAVGSEMAYSWDRLTLADRMGAIPEMLQLCRDNRLVQGEPI